MAIRKRWCHETQGALLCHINHYHFFFYKETIEMEEIAPFFHQGLKYTISMVYD